MSAESKQYMMALGYEEAIKYRSMRREIPEYGDVLETSDGLYFHVQNDSIPAHKTDWYPDSFKGNTPCALIFNRLDLVCVKYDAKEDVARWKLRRDMPGYGIPSF